MRGVAQAEIERRVEAVARRLGLEQLLDRRPAALSGGQRQRVALGRALARCGDRTDGNPGPNAVLLDEPLSNLDARLRLETRAELTRLHRELGVTMIYVTHDQEEAMTLGDRVAVLHAGRLEQVAPPLEVYREPASVFVADFIGVPPINWLEGRVDGDALVPDGEREALRIALPEGLRPGQGRGVKVGFRPSDVALTAPEPGGLRGAVDVLEALGSTLVAHVRTGAGALHRVSTSAETKLAVGESVGLVLAPERLHFFDAETGRRLAAETAEAGDATGG
jgi:multiple sugar transport system ATP-binding protein